jgi:hypothetical protein
MKALKTVKVKAPKAQKKDGGKGSYDIKKDKKV